MLSLTIHSSNILNKAHLFVCFEIEVSLPMLGLGDERTNLVDDSYYGQLQAIHTIVGEEWVRPHASQPLALPTLGSALLTVCTARVVPMNGPQRRMSTSGCVCCCIAAGNCNYWSVIRMQRDRVVTCVQRSCNVRPRRRDARACEALGLSLLMLRARAGR
jgi:hypothetical protein